MVNAAIVFGNFNLGYIFEKLGGEAVGVSLESFLTELNKAHPLLAALEILIKEVFISSEYSDRWMLKPDKVLCLQSSLCDASPIFFGALFKIFILKVS